MGKLTQVLVKSKECTESGFPKKLSVYHLGEARRVGNSFRVDVLVLREHDLELPSPPAHLQATSAEDARELVIQHYRGLAEEMKLDIRVTELEAR